MYIEYYLERLEIEGTYDHNVDGILSVIEHGMRSNMQNIVDSLSESDFYTAENYTEDGAYQSAYIGSIFSLTPSGKLYTPWAYSNVEPCPFCNWRGCFVCGYMGSIEVFLDSIFQDVLDNWNTGWFESGEGSMSDIFYCKPLD